MAADSDDSGSGGARARKGRKSKRVPLTRSENMARIRGKDSLAEMKVRRAFWAAGLGYRGIRIWYFPAAALLFSFMVASGIATKDAATFASRRLAQSGGPQSFLVTRRVMLM